MSLRAAVSIALLAGASRLSAADDTLPQPEPLPGATPILSIDDTRAHGPTARNFVDLELDTQRLAGRDDEALWMWTEELSIGNPDSNTRELHDLLSLFANFELRARTATLHTASGWMQAPLTLGLQRYYPIDPIAFLPLAFAHFGFEAVVATPWLSGRHEVPPTALRVTNAVDTELSENGWSIRPFSPYFRADFLACRTGMLDVGGAPELFLPETGPDEYYLHLHVALGFSFLCSDRVASTRPKVELEYRVRVQLHAGDRSVAYDDAVGVALQLDHAWFVIQPFITTNPGGHMFDYWSAGLRLQIGAAKDPKRS